MRYLSLFSGIEAASAAWHPLGWECVAVAEVEPVPCSVLAHHYGNVPNLGDVTKVDEVDILMLGHIDLVVFGSPCQDLSVAGKRKGLEGERSGLFFTAMRIIEWARQHCGCRFALWENVPGAFSSNEGRDFAAVVAHLAGLESCEVPPKGWGGEGCAVGEKGMVEWSTLDAQWFGVAQRRRRVFALADFGAWASRPPVLLEPESLRGDTPPSRETGQEAAGSLTCGASIGGGWRIGPDEAAAGHIQPVVATLDASYGRLQGCSGQDANHGHTHLVPVPAFGETARCLTVKSGGGANLDAETADFVVCATGHVAHALRADGFDASEDGTGRGTPIVVHGTQDPCCSEDTTFTLGRNNGGENVLAYGFQPRIARNGRGDMGDVVSALNAQSGETGKGDAAPCVAIAPAAAVDCYNGVIDGNVTMTLRSGNGNENGGVPAMMQAMPVRRLTPVECERLQGFPDNYTLVAHKGKPTADGPRYKALGNSMAVPVMNWIGRQVEFALAMEALL